VRRGLRGWDRCRFRAPAAPATSCPTPATGSPRRGGWRESETHIEARVVHFFRIHSEGVSSLSSPLFSPDQMMLLIQSWGNLHLSSNCCRSLNYFLKIVC
jgi:hypothetical protein